MQINVRKFDLSQYFMVILHVCSKPKNKIVAPLVWSPFDRKCVTAKTRIILLVPGVSRLTARYGSTFDFYILSSLAGWLTTENKNTILGSMCTKCRQSLGWSRQPGWCQIQGAEQGDRGSVSGVKWHWDLEFAVAILRRMEKKDGRKET